MLLKYSGISFISGAVNHGFFSGERSLWTAAIGMVLFVLGAALEHRLEGSQAGGPRSGSGLLRTLALGSLLSIGLGFFTGGLQHFPDSPARSAWVVPLGFFVSVLALFLSSTRTWQRALTVYSVVLGSLVSATSYAAWQWLESRPQGVTSGHSHGAATSDDHHNAAAITLPAPTQFALTALRVSRSVNVRMDDTMRFSPSEFQVQAGETIRFVVQNVGKLAHEMVLGNELAIRAHAEEMKQGAGHAAQDGHAGHGSSSMGGLAVLSLEAGQSGDLVVQFNEATTVQMACLIPGHFEAGMKGLISVAKGKGSAGNPAAAHDHASHKH